MSRQDCATPAACGGRHGRASITLGRDGLYIAKFSGEGGLWRLRWDQLDEATPPQQPAGGAEVAHVGKGAQHVPYGHGSAAARVLLPPRRMV
jgi:hypothetical protein